VENRLECSAAGGYIKDSEVAKIFLRDGCPNKGGGMNRKK
jgi:hypothetical protein